VFSRRRGNGLRYSSNPKRSLPTLILDGNKMKRPQESTRRWWMDREGNVWLNVAALRRKPLTDEEAKQMQQLAKEKAARGADELH